MKLKIIGGTLDVEVMDGSLSINDIKSMLKKMGEVQSEETITGIKEAGTKVSSHSSKSNAQDKLNAKAKMPI